MKPREHAVEWSDLYTEYRSQVLAFLQRRLWSRRELAEDLTQETFARAMGAATPLRDPARVRSYLLQTANNLLISHLRRGDRVTSESDLPTRADLASHPAEEGHDPLAASEAEQLREQVDRVLGELPRDQRIAFSRGVLQRVPYAELAEEQGWTVAKVKTDIFRARKALMAELGDFR